MDSSECLQKYYQTFAERMKLAGIEPHHKIAIGVSGGADSMALCILASTWKYTELGENAKTGDYINGLVALIVDHGLRAESSEEAACVQNWVSKLGIRCDILKCEWPNAPLKQGHLEEAARDARYKILKDKCQQYHIGVLLVAHHADDQAELFVLRLSRNSGLVGLAGMAFFRQLFSDISFDDYSILLVRPLLCFIKDDLYKICLKCSQPWVEDPTNQNLAFARNRIRRLLKNFLSCNFRSEVQRLISGCRRTREYLNKACNTMMNEALLINVDYGYAVVDAEKLFLGTLSDLCLSRFIVLVLQFISQKQKPVRGRVTEMLLKYIRNYPYKSALTVGGCHISPYPGSKGMKILICFSFDPLLSTSSQVRTFQNSDSEEMSSVFHEVENIIGASQEFSSSLGQTESEVPFLHVQKHEAILAEAKRLLLISESTFSRLLLLKDEMSKDFGSNQENGKYEENVSNKQTADRSMSDIVSISFEQTCYFTNRFFISWGNTDCGKVHDPRYHDAYHNLVGQTHINADRKCSGCFVDTNGTAWIRHMKDADWNCLSRLVNVQLPRKCVFPFKIDQEKNISGMHATAQEGQNPITCSDYVLRQAWEALERLKTLPLPARRGLPVLVNKQGSLLAIPSIHFKCCPYISTSATFKPRIPLGGGYTSWI